MTPAPDPRRPIGGVRVGQVESDDGTSGVTALLFDQSTPVVVDIRGGASATYDTGSLTLDATFGRRWGLFLTGGSVHGLDAAAGVRDRILDEGGGTRFFRNQFRIATVSGAALFDLPMTDRPLPDYRALGYEAARAAHRGAVATGRVGAGAGATVGKYRGRASAMRGGVGWSSCRVGRGRVAVLIAVNSVGGVRNPSTGKWVAGARGPRGRVLPPGTRPERSSTTGTTLTVILTDLAVDRPTLQRAASEVHAALGGAIVPFHSATDGDVLFAASTGTAGAPSPESRPGGTADALGSFAAACAIESVIGAVRVANSKP